MIGLILVTHGQLALEFVRAMEHVVGPQEKIEAICIELEKRKEGLRRDIALLDQLHEETAKSLVAKSWI